jgi:antitoxin (DNA-binding transcriptional repressor) of toxin-antitoxin stability system
VHARQYNFRLRDGINRKYPLTNQIIRLCVLSDMTLKQMTVTEAARNFSDLVSRVHYQGGTTILLKGGKPMVKLSPAARPKTGRELAALWPKRPALSPSEAASLGRDLTDSRSRLGPLASKWA